MCGKSYVTAATNTGSSCIIVHSNNHVYAARGDDRDHYHQLQHSHNGLRVVSLNVKRIRGHHDELKYLLINIRFYVLTLNETTVDNEVPDQIINIDGCPDGAQR